MTDDVDLDGFSMLKGVAIQLRRSLAASAQRRALAPGEVLITQGAPGQAMYFLLQGELAVALQDPAADPIAVITAGETVGELAVLDGSEASAYVVARTDCEVMALDEDAFWDLTQSSHAFAINLLVKLAERLRKNNATVSTNIEKRRLYERAAMFDGLTGIHNRRWLDETLHRLVDRHRARTSNGAPKTKSKGLCAALIDVDHFKRFNDGHGHDAGDAVLTSVAMTMAQSLRPTDLVARFGGEEFVILFPDTTIEEAVLAAERVREIVAGTDVTMRDGRALPRVTISLGVAELTEHHAPADLLKAADAAMYEAKRGGRNRVVVAR